MPSPPARKKQDHCLSARLEATKFEWEARGDAEGWEEAQGEVGDLMSSPVVHHNVSSYPMQSGRRRWMPFLWTIFNMTGNYGSIYRMKLWISGLKVRKIESHWSRVAELETRNQELHSEAQDNALKLEDALQQSRPKWLPDSWRFSFVQYFM